MDTEQESKGYKLPRWVDLVRELEWFVRVMRNHDIEAIGRDTEVTRKEWDEMCEYRFETALENRNYPEED